MGEKRSGRRVFEPETIERRGGRLLFRVPDQPVCQHRIESRSSRVLLFLHARKSSSTYGRNPPVITITPFDASNVRHGTQIATRRHYSLRRPRVCRNKPAGPNFSNEYALDRIILRKSSVTALKFVRWRHFFELTSGVIQSVR